MATSFSLMEEKQCNCSIFSTKLTIAELDWKVNDRA